jgi:hypothetical protein
MAEKTFRSPGFFESEIEIGSARNIKKGIPAGVIGTANDGPAFVPITVGSINEFKNTFGKLDREKFGPYAVASFLKNRDALTYIRVLGGGANLSSTHISTTELKGTVRNAGFRLSGSVPTGKAPSSENRDVGAVNFIAATHTLNYKEQFGYPIFSQNDSTPSTASGVQLIRGMVFLASGARLEVLDNNENYPASGMSSDDSAKINGYDGTVNAGTFKLVISSAIGSSFASDEKKNGIKIYTASLDPSSVNYIGKILNKDPDQFHEEQHLLYADFPVQKEIAEVTYHVSNNSVVVISGSSNTSTTGGDTSLYYRELFGSFNTRYQTAKSTHFISQPFGNKEYDLFYFESLSDGIAGNEKVKISISNIKRSSDKNNPYGTFTVLVRDYYDDDYNQTVLEQYSNCSLNPSSADYIINKIGDKKISFNFDAVSADEKRLNSTGIVNNKSKHIRVVVHKDVADKKIPSTCIPFGFRGLKVLKTSNTLTDNGTAMRGFADGGGDTISRLHANGGSMISNNLLVSAILPPVPFTFKQTKNPVSETASASGMPGDKELADSRIYWGIKTSNLPLTSSIGDSVLISNGALGTRNQLIDSYSKFLGIDKLDTLVTGSGADYFCNNKFSLSKVVLNNQSDTSEALDAAIITEITGTASEHIRDAAYIRNGDLSTPNYTILDKTYSKRLTFASLLNADSSEYFNRFSNFMKFTNIVGGGFDGLNILDKDQRKMNDRATSTLTKGKASGNSNAYENLGPYSAPGSGVDNNSVNSYRTAVNIMTDELSTNVNLITIPGIKDSLITDHAIKKTKEYSKALYILDIPSWDYNNDRLFDDDTKTPSVLKTLSKFQARAIDNNYAATYFPDVIKRFSQDDGGILTIPASIAALQAIGHNDKLSFPWFAPAGFNRGALSDVINTRVRLNTEDRNLLYESNINPIAAFSNNNFVIFGQKTLQQSRSALDRVNVRRMLLEVKRIISIAANDIIFEQNTLAVRNRFIAALNPQLGIIQSQQGIESFRVIMNETNNSQVDIENNRLNGKIILVPTRTIEYIAVDFIITNSGVNFE